MICRPLLSYVVYGKVCTKLKVRDLTFNDIRGLAEKVGFERDYTEVIDQRFPNPTEEILKAWSRKSSINQSTLFKQSKWLSKLVFRHAV